MGGAEGVLRRCVGACAQREKLRMENGFQIKKTRGLWDVRFHGQRRGVYWRPNGGDRLFGCVSVGVGR